MYVCLCVGIFIIGKFDLSVFFLITITSFLTFIIVFDKQLSLIENSAKSMDMFFSLNLCVACDFLLYAGNLSASTIVTFAQLV